MIGNNRPSDESEVEDFDKVNGVNYRGLWLCSREELRIMKKQEMLEVEGGGAGAGIRRQRGSIVNVASQLGIVGRTNAREFHKADFSTLCPGDAGPKWIRSGYPHHREISLKVHVHAVPVHTD